jgi:hypothetical protein
MVALGARVALVAALVGAACGESIKGAVRAALSDLPACAVCAPPAGASACSDGSTISKAFGTLNGVPLGPGAEYCFCKVLDMSGGKAGECNGVAYVKPIPTCPAKCQPTAAQTAAQNPITVSEHTSSTSSTGSVFTAKPVHLFSSDSSSSSTSKMTSSTGKLEAPAAAGSISGAPALLLPAAAALVASVFML